MTAERYEEIIKELTAYWNMETNSIEREEINRKIKRYKDKLKKIKG